MHWWQRTRLIDQNCPWSNSFIVIIFIAFFCLQDSRGHNEWHSGGVLSRFLSFEDIFVLMFSCSERRIVDSESHSTNPSFDGWNQWFNSWTTLKWSLNTSLREENIANIERNCRQNFDVKVRQKTVGAKTRSINWVFNAFLPFFALTPIILLSPNTV